MFPKKRPATYFWRLIGLLRSMVIILVLRSRGISVDPTKIDIIHESITKINEPISRFPPAVFELVRSVKKLRSKPWLPLVM